MIRALLRSPAFATALVVAVLYLLGSAAFRGFGSPRAAIALLGDNGVLGVAAVGATFVLLAGGVDLSAGAVAALASAVLARLLLADVAPGPAFGAVVLGGAAFGALQGLTIVGARAPAFLVTLAGMFAARGLAHLVLPAAVAIKHPFVLETLPERWSVPLGGGLVLPPAALALLGAVLLGLLIERRTRFGLRVRAVGDDAAAAEILGVPVGRVKVAAYAFAGASSAAAGAAYAAYTQSGDPTACVGFELDVIAAAVIGGTSPAGGVGGVLGTALGVLACGLMQALVTFHGGLSAWTTRIGVGGLVLAFVLARAALGRAARGSTARA